MAGLRVCVGIVCGYCLNWKVCFTGVGKNERKNEEMEALCVEEKMKNEEMRRIERKETKKREKRVWERESRWGIVDMTWQDKPVDPMSGMKLPYCHYNSISITWKHLKYFFSFHNSSLKNKRIEWWKQKLETHSNTLLSHETHQFWVTGDGNRVMGNGNWRSK